MGEVQAEAVYGFDAKVNGDLSFAQGEIITVIDQAASGWWVGRTKDGRTGVFPYNRVKIIESRPVPPPPSGGRMMVTDRVTGVKIGLEEPLGRFNHKFQVILDLSNGKKVRSPKTMKDFRLLNDALNILNKTASEISGYDSAERTDTVIPEWADNIELPPGLASSRMRERGVILQDFLSRNKNKKLSGYLLVYWLNPNTEFALDESEKRKVGEAYRAAEKSRMNAPPVPDPPMARALYNWDSRDDPENLIFTQGEVFAVDEDSEFEGWWMGEKVNGAKGIFPFNYVAKLSPQESSKLLHPERVVADKVPPPPPIEDMKPPPFEVNAPATGTQARGIDLGPQFGPASRNDRNQYTNKTSKVFTSPGAKQEARARVRIEKYALSCPEAFDELLQTGVTIEENGKLANFGGVRDTPRNGDTVTVFYSGFIWEPQKQQLLEFASSDKLVSSGGIKTQDGPLVFVIGENRAIDGVEESVAKMTLGQSVRVTLSPEKAYGEVGDPPNIPPRAYLVYDLTLNRIDRGTRAAGVAAPQGAMRALVQPKPRGGSQRGFMGGSSRRDFSRPGAAGGVGPEHFKKKLTLEKLRFIVQRNQYFEYGIQKGVIEEYLTEEEFQRAFGMNTSAWLLQPGHKRRAMKQEVGLM